MSAVAAWLSEGGEKLLAVVVDILHLLCERSSEQKASICDEQCGDVESITFRLI